MGLEELSNPLSCLLPVALRRDELLLGPNAAVFASDSVTDHFSWPGLLSWLCDVINTCSHLRMCHSLHVGVHRSLYQCIDGCLLSAKAANRYVCSGPTHRCALHDHDAVYFSLARFQ